MSWLARLEVDAETIRAEGISNDIYVWHKKLWECYPDMPDITRDFLTRIDQLEGAYRFWVLAKRKPVRPQWCPPEGFALKEIAPSFLTHRYYAFDLRAECFQHLLTAEGRGELYPRVRRMVLMAKSQGVPVNYAQLVTDLKFWFESDRKKTEWAIAFWDTSPTHATEEDL